MFTFMVAKVRPVGQWWPLVMFCSWIKTESNKGSICCLFLFWTAL